MDELIEERDPERREMLLDRIDDKTKGYLLEILEKRVQHTLDNLQKT